MFKSAMETATNGTVTANGIHAGNDAPVDQENTHPILSHCIDGKNITITQPYRHILPGLASYEIEAMRAEWERRGRFRHPGTATEDGRLLDGHHCLDIDPNHPIVLEPGSEKWTREECIAWRIRRAYAQRSLSGQQKVEVDRTARETARKLHKDQKYTQEVLAKMFGVHQTTIGRWLNKGSNKGSNMHVHNASRLDARVKVSPQKRAEMHQRHKAGEDLKTLASEYKVCEKTVRDAVKKESNIQEVRARGDAVKEFDPHGPLRLEERDCWSIMSELEEKSIDAIITDVPYDWNGIFERISVECLGCDAIRLLTDNGVLILYSGQEYYQEVREILEGREYVSDGDWHLSCQWEVTVVYNGPLRLHGHWFSNTQKAPVLVYSKPGCEGRRITKSDVVWGGTPKKELHKWKKTDNEMAALVDLFTKPGDTILDPFMGAGTTGYAALLGGRKFIGIESNPDHYRTAKGLLADVKPDQKRFEELILESPFSKRKSTRST